jgi:hypothetical protein
MKTLKTLIITLVATVASISFASAQTRFHVSVNTPGVHVSAGNSHRGYGYNRGYYRPVAYRPYYHPYYRPVGYHSYYSRPVYHTTYYRHVYTRPAYHRVYRRW